MNTEAEKQLRLARKQWEAYCDHIEEVDDMKHQVFDTFRQILDKVLESDIALRNRFILSVECAATHRKLTTDGMAAILEAFAYLEVDA